MNILVPIFKLGISSLLLYTYYLVFLKDRQHHRFNRNYLLGLIIFSVLVAFVQIPVSFDSFTKSGSYIVKSLEIASGSGFGHESGIAVPGNSQGIDFKTVLIWMYGIGVVVSCTIFLRTLYSLVSVMGNSNSRLLYGYRVYFIEHPGAPFTFLDRIFLPSNMDLNDPGIQLILQHESWHVKDRHGWDILFLECAKIIFWFNPVFYLVKRELMTVHEFIADEHTAPIQCRADYAEYLLMYGIDQKRNQVPHYFFHQPIKRRILMLVKNHPLRKNYWTRYAVLPLAAILFLGFVLSAQKDKSMFEKTGLGQDIVVCIDAGHGGADGGATGANGVLESDLNLALAQKIESLSANFPVRVVLTRATAALPGNETEIAASLKKRVEIAKNAQATLFVSLHMGAGSNDHHYTVYLPNPQKYQSDYSACTRLGSSMVAALKNGFPISEQLIVSNKNIWVLNSSPVPAILMECGNISNDADLAFISDPVNQEKLAKSILEGIVAYAGK